jgi:hypothetical protein
MRRVMRPLRFDVIESTDGLAALHPVHSCSMELEHTLFCCELGTLGLGGFYVK